MTSVIPNPPVPTLPVYEINAGDSVVIYDLVSQSYIGPVNSVGNLAPVTSSSSALVFTIGFNGNTSPSQTEGVVTYGGRFSASPYSTNITLQTSKGYLWAQSWINGGLQLSTPSSVVNNQPYLWTISAFYSPASGSPVTAAIVNQEPAACGGACNLFTLTNAADTSGRNPLNYVPSQATPSGPYAAYFQLGTSGTQMAKPKQCQLQFFLVNPSTACGSNYDCTSSSAPMCFNSKCYPINSLSSNQIANNCSYTSAAPNNNMISAPCQTWCTSQPLNTPYRSNCDNSMINFCPASNPDGVTHPPLTATPCTCILAQASGIPNPECFSAACASAPTTGPQNYYTTTMQSTLNQKDCLQSCQVQLNCIEAGTCTVSNNLFCQTCDTDTSPAVSKFCGNPTPPTPSNSFFSKILTWIKDNKAIAIASSAGLLVVIALFIVLAKQTRKSSSK